MAFTIKQNDTLPILEAFLTSGPSAGSQTAVNLAGASVNLVMKQVGGGAATRLFATILDAPNGKVGRVWATGDTATAAGYNCEWEVAFAVGKIQTFPNESYFTITIADDLD